MLYVRNIDGTEIEWAHAIPECSLLPQIKLCRAVIYDGFERIHDYNRCNNAGTEGMFDIIGRTFTEMEKMSELLDGFKKAGNYISITVGG